MPMYAYICNDCGHTFDKLRTMQQNDDDVRCEQCASTHIRRAIPLIASVARSDDGGIADFSPSFAGGGTCCGGNCHN